jgi:O-methyltransferase involved in polyketide biosynthesis
MEHRTDHEKVSHTAVMCAKGLGRETDVPYAREIWDHLKRYDATVVREGDDFVDNMFRAMIMRFPGMSGLRAILEGRYIAINNVLEEAGNPHVLELASGLSPRGLDFTRKDSTRLYLETDLPGLQEIKKEIVGAIRTEEASRGLPPTPNYHLTPLNVIDGKSFREAVKPYADAFLERPLAVVNAGLLMYLSKDEQKRARDNIASILREFSPDGMWATPDLVIDMSNFRKNPLMKHMINRIEKRTGRKLTSFESTEQVEEFLEDGGFNRVERIPSAYLTETLSSVRKLGLNPEKVRQKSSLYDVYTAKLS